MFAEFPKEGFNTDALAASHEPRKRNDRRRLIAVAGRPCVDDPVGRGYEVFAGVGVLEMNRLGSTLMGEKPRTR